MNAPSDHRTARARIGPGRVEKMAQNAYRDRRPSLKRATRARKLPQALGYYREALRSTGLRIVHDPTPEDDEACQDIIAHRGDVPIVVAAMKADVDYLATFNRGHFIDDPEVTLKSGIPIGTPGDALAWVRAQLAQQTR